MISESPNSAIQAETHVVAGPNGIVAVAWIDVDFMGQSQMGYTFSTDDGASFAAPSTLVSPGNRVGSDPVLAVDQAGNIYMVWVAYRIMGQNPVSMRIYVSRADAGTTTFGPPIQVSQPMDTGALYDKPWITVTNKGTILITYQRDVNGQDFSLVSARSLDGGNNWTRSFIAQDPSGQTFRNLAFPCAPLTGDHVWTTYLAFDQFGLETKLARSDDDGITWQPEVTVNQANEPVAFDDPNCVAEGNDVWVSYGLSNDPIDQMAATMQKLYSIQLAHSSDAGQTISDRVEAGDVALGQLFLHPELARQDSGAIDIVYYAGATDEDANGTYRRSRVLPPGGAEPSSIVESPITYLMARGDARWLGDYTGIHWRGGQLYTSYVVNTSGLAHVAFAKYAVP